MIGIFINPIVHVEVLSVNHQEVVKFLSAVDQSVQVYQHLLEVSSLLDHRTEQFQLHYGILVIHLVLRYNHQAKLLQLLLHHQKVVVLNHH